MEKMRWLGTSVLVGFFLLGCRAEQARLKPAMQVRVEGAQLVKQDEEIAEIPEPGKVPQSGEETPSEKSETPKEASPEPGPKAAREEPLVSIDVVEADITDVLRSLAYQSGANLILTPGVKGRITMHLEDVTWQEALEAALQAGGFVQETKKGFIRILTPQQRQAERERLDKERRPTTEIFFFNNAEVKGSSDAFKGLLSPAGKLSIDERLNAIVVTDYPENIEAFGRVAAELDKKAPQVMIQALIVDVRLTDDLRLGVDWNAVFSDGKVGLVGFQNLSEAGGLGPGGSITFTYLSRNWDITTLMDFLQHRENVDILADPKILVLDGKQASIEIIEEIPYQELTQTAEGGQIGTTGFKEVGVKLRVTPRITDDGFITMNVKPEQSATTGADISGIPVVETRKADTTLRVKDNQTIVIGGLRRKGTTETEDKVPILGDIPLIGFLFRHRLTTETERELTVFITPSIYTTGQLSEKEKGLRDLMETKKKRTFGEKVGPLR